jgi:ABC-2 type transport system permease protein
VQWGPRAESARRTLSPTGDQGCTGRGAAFRGLLLGLCSFTDEFRYGSIVPTLLSNPDPRRVLGAKVVATAGGGSALTLAATAVSIAIGVPLLLAKGVEVAWSASAMAEVVGRLVGATVLWTAIGVGLGLVVKHQVAAIAGALVWLLAAEGIVSGLMSDIGSSSPVRPASRSSASILPTSSHLVSARSCSAAMRPWPSGSARCLCRDGTSHRWKCRPGEPLGLAR